MITILTMTYQTLEKAWRGESGEGREVFLFQEGTKFTCMSTGLIGVVIVFLHFALRFGVLARGSFALQVGISLAGCILVCHTASNSAALHPLLALPRLKTRSFRDDNHQLAPGSSTAEPFWVPYDDDYTPEKRAKFSKVKTELLRQAATAVGHFGEASQQFMNLESINKLYTAGTAGPQYPLPAILNGDEGEWGTDATFGRQRIDGINPAFIEAINRLPEDSHISTSLLQPALMDGVGLQERLRQGKIFMIDYTPALLQFTQRINAQTGPHARFQYAPRCLLYLNKELRLLPIAIELMLSKDNHSSGQVYTPLDSQTEWMLAKSHFLAADFTIHELYSNFIRCYACTEPYIISARRNLSTAHPVFQLLIPHFRNILRANAVARQALINPGGILESILTPGRCIEDISMSLYSKLWRFKTEGLPADLVKRKMATVREGANWRAGEVDLVLEDYPYAANGLQMWKSLHKWVSTYLSIHYIDPSEIYKDHELQIWWEEIKHKGHPDLLSFNITDEENMWPPLNSVEDLTYILVTMIWVASGHRAAVTFQKYNNIGYMPNMPSCMVAQMPTPPITTPSPSTVNETVFLQSLPSPIVTTQAMSIARLWPLLGWDDKNDVLQNELWLPNSKVKRMYCQFLEDVNASWKRLSGETSLVHSSFPC